MVIGLPCHAPGERRRSEGAAERPVEQGEDVVITRRGRPVAQVIPIDRPLKPLDLDALRAFREKRPEQKVSAGELIRRMRDTDRY